MQDGAVISQNVSVNDVPPTCSPGMSQALNHSNAVLSCMQAHGYRQFVTYQPANRYWEFQDIETVIFVAIAAALLALTYVVVTRRDA